MPRSSPGEGAWAQLELTDGSRSVSRQLKFNVSAFPYKIFFYGIVKPSADFSNPSKQN